MNLATLLRITLPSALALLAGADLAAQTVNYLGVGGRHEQNLYAIQRNVPLPIVGTAPTIQATANNRRIFVRFLTGSSAVDVSGFEVTMKYSFLGEVVPAWIYTANAQNAPGSAVLQGEIGIGVNLHACRASFASTYTVQPNTLYFLAFQLPAGEELTFGTVQTWSPATQVTYFVGASGSAQQATLQYGVHTDGQSPAISLTQPQIGNPFTVGLTHAAINQPAVLWAALYTAPWTVNLRGLGAQGSFWYLDGGAFPVSPALVANNRQRSQAFWLPNDPILIGFPLAFQWQLATNSPANGWATSNAATCTIL